jgi:hypothetical protein
VMELTTILVIPMALKLFSLKVIRRKLLAEKGDALLFWGTTRMPTWRLILWCSVWLREE